MSKHANGGVVREIYAAIKIEFNIFLLCENINPFYLLCGDRYLLQMVAFTLEH